MTMTLTTEQFNDAIARGFTAPTKPARLSGFAEACYDMNSYADICDCKSSPADTTDMATWEISEDEWRAAQTDAIEAAMFKYVDTHAE